MPNDPNPEMKTETIASKTAVIIINYRAGEALLDCLQSIQKTEPEIEIVIVDNSSPDGSTARAVQLFPEMHLVENDENVGFGAGANLGAAETAREFLVFLNPDTEVLDGWLQAMIAPLIEDPTVGMVTPKVLLRSDPQKINVAGLDVHLSGISMCRGADAASVAYSQRQEIAAISGVAFAVRRAVFEELGGFDPAFFLYMEDVDLSLRAWLSGYKCLYVPQAVVLHDYELSLDPRKTFFVERGRYWILLKCFKWRTLFALLPTLLLAEVITWGWVLLKRPGAIPQKLRAYWWVVRNWRKIANRRKYLQKMRTITDAELLHYLSWSLDFRQLAGGSLAEAAWIVFNPLLKAISMFVRRLVR
jgi:GT2 family glycosyltransferase